MDKIDKEELLAIITKKIVNSKNNNLIIAGNDSKSIIDEIPDTSSILLIEDNIKNNALYNIKIDLNKTKIQDIFKYIISYLQDLNLLDTEKKYHLLFDNKIDVWRLDRVLKENNIIIQLIFYNIEVLSIEEQELFNELYYYFSYNFFVISLVNEHFNTYFLTNNRVLDSREDYQRFVLEDYQRYVLKKQKNSN